MFLYCEDVRLQAYSLILLGMHVQCIEDYCGGRGLWDDSSLIDLSPNSNIILSAEVLSYSYSHTSDNLDTL